MPGAAPSAHENPPLSPFFKGGDQFQSFFNPPFRKGGLGGFKGIIYVIFIQRSAPAADDNNRRCPAGVKARPNIYKYFE